MSNYVSNILIDDISYELKDSEARETLTTKANTSSVYTKEEVNALIKQAIQDALGEGTFLLVNPLEKDAVLVKGD